MAGCIQAGGLKNWHHSMLHAAVPSPRCCMQVEEMQRTVSVAEKNPARFGLSQPEINSRRTWINATKQEVSSRSALP